MHMLHRYLSDSIRRRFKIDSRYSRTEFLENNGIKKVASNIYLVEFSDTKNKYPRPLVALLCTTRSFFYPSNLRTRQFPQMVIVGILSSSISFPSISSFPLSKEPRIFRSSVYNLKTLCTGTGMVIRLVEIMQSASKGGQLNPLFRFLSYFPLTRTLRRIANPMAGSYFTFHWLALFLIGSMVRFKEKHTRTLLFTLKINVSSMEQDSAEFFSFFGGSVDLRFAEIHLDRLNVWKWLGK